MAGLGPAIHEWRASARLKSKSSWMARTRRAMTVKGRGAGLLRRLGLRAERAEGGDGLGEAHLPGGLLAQRPHVGTLRRQSRRRLAGVDIGQRVEQELAQLDDRRVADAEVL